MICGTRLIPMLYANSLDTLELIDSTIGLSLVKELVPFGWIMFNVHLLTTVLEIARSTDLPITTVSTVKMFL